MSKPNVKAILWKETHYAESEDYAAYTVVESWTPLGRILIEYNTDKDNPICFIHSCPWNRHTVKLKVNIEEVKRKIEEQYKDMILECLE
jgi:hypothetical protein